MRSGHNANRSRIANQPQQKKNRNVARNNFSKARKQTRIDAEWREIHRAVIKEQRKVGFVIVRFATSELSATIQFPATLWNPEPDRELGESSVAAALWESFVIIARWFSSCLLNKPSNCFPCFSFNRTIAQIKDFGCVQQQIDRVQLRLVHGDSTRKRQPLRKPNLKLPAEVAIRSPSGSFQQ